MISDVWYSEIESTLYTHLQYKLADMVGAPYPQLNCTTSSQSESIDNIDIFPTLYIHMLSPIEIGNDLRNEQVAAVNATIELQVFSDVSESECRKIITSAVQEMKSLHFNVAMFPDPQTADKKYFAIARFTRVIASGDQDIVPR